MLTYRLYSKDGKVLIESGVANNIKELKEFLGSKVTCVRSLLFYNAYECFLNI